MSEVIKWLESEQGQAWSRSKHKPVWRPLIVAVKDGDASNIMGDFCIIWLA